MLRKAHFEIMMITGDNLLTAMAVAGQLDLGHSSCSSKSKDSSTLLVRDSRLVLTRRSLADRVIGDDVTPRQLVEMVERQSASLLGMDGECLAYLSNRLPASLLGRLLRRVQVFGRTSPAQKE